MNNCLITGGTGLIGEKLVDKMLSIGWRVNSLVRKKNDKVNNPNHLQHIYDFSTTHVHLNEFISEPIDSVIHLVQSNNYKDFPSKAEDIFYTNINSTFEMLEFARRKKARNFILASSGGIYGAGEEAFKEYDARIRQDNLGFYLGTKMCAETLAENYKDFMNIIILRFFFVYGERQRRNMLMPRLISSVIEERPIILQGDEGININPIYVDDAVLAIINALSLNTSSCINIAGKDVVSLKSLALLIGDILCKEPLFNVEEKNPKHLVADIDKMVNLLGAPKVDLKSGLKRMINCEKERK